MLCCSSFFYLVANNEIPAPSVRVPTTDSARRGSSDRQQSHRYSRQESSLIKPQAQNLREVDESKQEEDDAGYNERISNTKENSNQDEETEMTTTNCSIM